MTMNAEDYLAEVQKATDSIERKRDELERVRSMVQSVTQDITPRESCHVPMVSDRTGDKIIALMEAEQAYVDALELAVGLRAECSELLDKLENPAHARVLHRRYLLDEPWTRIAEKMGYSYHHVHKLHNAAVKKFQEVLDEVM